MWIIQYYVAFVCLDTISLGDRRDGFGHPLAIPDKPVAQLQFHNYIPPSVLLCKSFSQLVFALYALTDASE
jgi:hypothetical protein